MLIDHEPIDLLKILLLTGETELDVIVSLFQCFIPEAIHVKFR